MLANSSKYAVKAVDFLVNNSSVKRKFSVKDIAIQIDVPKPYLSKLLQKLSSRDYISSIQGRGGGFYLTPEQLEASILDIIVEVEGKNRFMRCAINFDNCNAENPCAIHHLISSEQQALRVAYHNIKLKDLAN